MGDRVPTGDSAALVVGRGVAGADEGSCRPPHADGPGRTPTDPGARPPTARCFSGRESPRRREVSQEHPGSGPTDAGLAAPIGSWTMNLASLLTFRSASSPRAAVILDGPSAGGRTAPAPIECRQRVTLDDGGVLLAGVGRGGHHAVARLLPDGSVDAGFGAGGVAEGPALGEESSCAALALQPDGSIVSVGEIWRDDVERSEPMIARHDASGRPDATFGHGGLAVTSVGCSATFEAVALQPDGKIVASGIAEGGIGLILVRYESNGALDTSFGTGGIVRLS